MGAIVPMTLAAASLETASSDIDKKLRRFYCLRYLDQGVCDAVREQARSA